MQQIVCKIIEAVRERQGLLISAESLTGGMIAEAITAVAGASQVFWGGWVTYAAEAKIQLLAVPAAVIDQYGVVSCETAEAMAYGAIQTLQAAQCKKPLYAIAATGIAGPGGGTAAVPVGTVCIACTAAHTEKLCTASKKYLFIGNRTDIREKTVYAALKMLLHYLTKQK